MSTFKKPFRVVLIIVGLTFVFIFRRELIDNQVIVMTSLYILFGIVFLLWIGIIYINKKVDSLIENKRFSEAIILSKKLRVYPNLSQSLILTTLINALNNDRLNFFYTNVGELNWSKGYQWRYFIEMIYSLFNDDRIGIEKNFSLLQDLQKSGSKLKNINEIISISTIIKEEEEITLEYYNQNQQFLEVVGKSPVLNELIKKALGISTKNGDSENSTFYNNISYKTKEFILAILIYGVICISPIILIPSLRDISGTLIGLFVFIMVLGLLDFKSKVVLNEDSIDRITPFSRVTLNWDDIIEIKWRPFRNTLTLKDEKGKKLAFYKGLRNYRDLFKTIKEKLVFIESSVPIPEAFDEFCRSNEKSK